MSSLNIQNVSAESLQADSANVTNLTATTLNGASLADILTKTSIPTYADVAAARAALSEGDLYTLDGENVVRVIREEPFYAVVDTFDGPTINPAWALAFNANTWSATPDPVNTHTLGITSDRLHATKPSTGVYQQIAHRPDFPEVEVGKQLSVDCSNWNNIVDFNGIALVNYNAFSGPNTPSTFRFLIRKDTGVFQVRYESLLLINETGMASLVQNASTLAIRRTATHDYEFWIDDTLVYSYTIAGSPPNPPVQPAIWLDCRNGRSVQMDDFKVSSF